jgi:hypothetical protein
MKTRILFLLLMLFGFAQIGAAYPNNYTLYMTFTAPDANTFNYTAHITGNMLPPVPPMGGVLHTPKFTFALGSQQNNYQGQGVCPTCDMNWYTYPTANFLNDCGDTDGPCSGTEEMQIQCSILGTFITAGPSGNPIYGVIYRRAISMLRNTYVPIGDFGWQVAAKCSIYVNPPDFNATAIINPTFQPPPPDSAAYYKARAKCFRGASSPSGSPWTCSPTFEYLELNETQEQSEALQHGDGTSYFCTNIDKGYTGKPFP